MPDYGPPSSITNVPNGILSLLSDPGVLASLQNTLTPAGVLNQMQAENERQKQELAAKTAEATRAATAAGTQYQQAAAAPPPQLSPVDQAIPTLFGNVASVLSGDNGYAQRAHKNITEAHDALLQARVQNLTALRDQYNTKAQAAEQAGNLEMSLTSRAKMDTLDKTLQTLLEGQKEKAARDLEGTKMAGELQKIHATGEEARKTLLTKLGADTAAANEPVYNSQTFETAGGSKVMDITQFKGKDLKPAQQWAVKNGYRPVTGNDAERFKTAKEVVNDMDVISSVAEQILPSTQGMSWGDAMKTKVWKEAKNRLSAAAGQGPAASFGNAQIAGIRNIQALAAGAGSGFRLNVQEVNMMKENWPKMSDSIEQARDKLAWEKAFLLNKENAYLGKPPLPMPPMSWTGTGTASSDPNSYRRQ